MGRNYSFFAGANSETGFVSFYKSFDSDLDNTAVFNIVGGPGTGKSSLMKKISRLADDEDLVCEKYFCSSDPNSLDAVRLISSDGMRKIVVCDATSPHPRDFSTPGAVGRLIDLSAFWNCGKLMKEKTHILGLQERKRISYGNAYGFLKIAGSVLREAVKLRVKQYDTDKLRRSLGWLQYQDVRLAIIERPVRCVSMFGEKILDNKGYSAKNKYYVDGMADCFIVLRSLPLDNAGVFAAPHPVVNCFYDEVFIPAADFSISCISSDEAEEFDIFRFFIKKEDPAYTELMMTYDKMVGLAAESLSEARECHFALEDIYGSVMDFSAKEEYDNEMVKDISLIIK